MARAPTRRARTGTKGSRLVGPVAAAALLLALSACSPVETYRNLIGTGKDDPNPATTPNTKNLAAGDAADYPNLATVPAPPTQALSTAQMDKLTQSLIADRTNAKYTTEQLQAGFDQSAGSVPPPPPPTAAPSPPAAAGAAAAGSVKPASQPVAGAAAPAAARAKSGALTGSAAPGPRKSGQPPEPGPMESSLQSPQLPSLPSPEQPQPAPPPPPALELPSATAAKAKPSGPAHLPPPPAAPGLPAAIASAKFEPPPPPPVLPPATPTRAATANAPQKVAAAQASAVPVAQVDFAAGSTTLDATGRQELAQVVPLYRHHPGKVRIIGYSGVGESAAQQLDDFQTALDRAHAVAAALTKAGIPAGKILVEAAPAGSDAGQGRAEILFER